MKLWLQVLFAQRLEVGQGANRPGRLARHIKPQLPNLQFLPMLLAAPRPSFGPGCQHSAHPRALRAPLLAVRGGVRFPAPNHQRAILQLFLAE